MTDTPAQDNTPLPVRHAMAALDILRTEDATQAERVAKILPGYAKRMDQRGVDDEICFDSLETLGTRVSSDQWIKLIRQVGKELTEQNAPDVTALHVGLGGNTPYSFSDMFDQASIKPRDYKGYRDSAQQVRVWKR